jgi:hypothetical protein
LKAITLFFPLSRRLTKVAAYCAEAVTDSLPL